MQKKRKKDLSDNYKNGTWQNIQKSNDFILSKCKRKNTDLSDDYKNSTWQNIQNSRSK